MDVVRSFAGRFSVGNNSRYWKCEINFPPVLDEHFSVNTSKQQIIPNDRFLDTWRKNRYLKILNKIEKSFMKKIEF